MIQSRITIVCVLPEIESSACVHTKLVSSVFLDIWLISSQYNYYHRPNASSFRCSHKQRIEQAQMVYRKEAEDLVNRHEEIQNINVANC